MLPGVNHLGFTPERGSATLSSPPTEMKMTKSTRRRRPPASCARSGRPCARSCPQGLLQQRYFLFPRLLRWKNRSRSRPLSAEKSPLKPDCSRHLRERAGGGHSCSLRQPGKRIRGVPLLGPDMRPVRSSRTAPAAVLAVPAAVLQVDRRGEGPQVPSHLTRTSDPEDALA